MPVWLVLDAEKLYLLTVRGSDTQWYLSVLKNPSIRIDARGVQAELRASRWKRPDVQKRLPPRRQGVGPTVFSIRGSPYNC